MNRTIVAIKNPNESIIVIDDGIVLGGQEVAEEYGPKINRGAFVTLIDLDWDGNADGDAECYVADRNGDRVYLQSNSNLGEESSIIDSIGPVETYSDGVPLEGDEPEPVELETFTVFGNNDENENFVAVVSATPETVRDAGIRAGLVDPGYESSVQIVLIARGDQSALGEENLADAQD